MLYNRPLPHLSRLIHPSSRHDSVFFASPLYRPDLFSDHTRSWSLSLFVFLPLSLPLFLSLHSHHPLKPAHQGPRDVVRLLFRGVCVVIVLRSRFKLAPRPPALPCSHAPCFPFQPPNACAGFRSARVCVSLTTVVVSGGPMKSCISSQHLTMLHRETNRTDRQTEAGERLPSNISSRYRLFLLFFFAFILRVPVTPADSEMKPKVKHTLPKHPQPNGGNAFVDSAGSGRAARWKSHKVTATYTPRTLCVRWLVRVERLFPGLENESESEFGVFLRMFCA